MAGTTARSTSTRKPSTSKRGSNSDDPTDTPPVETTDTEQGGDTNPPPAGPTGDENTPDPEQTADPLATAGPVHGRVVGDSTPDGGELTEEDTFADLAANDDPAAAVKAARARLRVTQESHPGGELTEGQRVAALGISQHSVGSSRTLLRGTPPPRVGVGISPGYETAPDEAFIAWVPRGSKQATAIRVWAKDQLVRRDVLEALTPYVANKAIDTTPLTEEQYHEVAAYL